MKSTSFVITPHGFPFSIDTETSPSPALPVRLTRPANGTTPEVNRLFETVEQAEEAALFTAEVWAGLYGEPIPTGPVHQKLQDAKERAEFAAFLDREIEAARARFFAQTPEQKERIRSWNEYADRKNAAA